MRVVETENNRSVGGTYDRTDKSRSHAEILLLELPKSEIKNELFARLRVIEQAIASESLVEKKFAS